MKISSASKKVLASALSAAMVVAFAPAVALAAPTSTIPTKDADDAAMAQQGYVAKVFDGTSSSVGYKYYTVADINAASAENAYTLISDVDDMITLSADATIDMAGHKIETADKGAINLNGHNLTLKKGTVSAAKDLNNTKQVAIYDGDDADASANTLTLEGVDVSGDAGAISVGQNSSDKVVVKGGKLGTVNAKSVEVSGTVEAGAITGAVKVAKKGALTVATENAASHEAGDGDGCTAGSVKSNDATGISAGLELLEGAAATVTATSKAGVAKAVAGDVSLAKSATVTATAKSVANDKDAYGIYGAVSSQGSDGKFVQGATVNAAAVSSAKAYGIYANSNAVKMNAGTVSGEGATDADSYAVHGTGSVLAGGTFTGKIETSATVTGGKYSVNPEKYVDTDTYNVSKADGVYTVQQFTDFSITGKGAIDSGSDVVKYVKAATQQMVKGETPAGIKLAEGVTAADFIAQAEKGLKVNAKVVAYNEKNATDEQKAAKKAIDEALKTDLYKLKTENSYSTVTITLEYDKAGQVEPVVLGTVTELGQIQSGMGTKQAVLEIDAASGAHETQSVYSVTGGKAAKTAWKKNLDGKDTDTVEFTAVPTLFTYAVIDQDAVKDAAKGDKPDTPAAEKATQGIDVAKKSKTVKIKSAKKTKKAQSFNMGLSAQTAVTTAKASGSKYVTVKGGKVTLKKGVKKGTYKAKVTINAAASDAYLAAAKTVTVTFKVTK